MYIVFVFLIGVTTVTAIPHGFHSDRIVGGSKTTISEYPFAAALLWSFDGNNHRQSCGGSIINSRSVLTAAHCFNMFPSTYHWRTRVGSTFANSMGIVYNTERVIVHPEYNRYTNDNDFAILRVVGVFAYSFYIQSVSIAGPNYNLIDNQVVWAIGWGTTSFGGNSSEQLRHVQVWTVNQNICAERYAPHGLPITENMLCAGWLDVGGRDACTGDSGGSLLHNGVVVGVISAGRECAHPRYPGVNARVSRVSLWIQNNA